MAGSLNRVIILGNLGQDPELRYTQSQMPVCTLNIATTDVRTGNDGQKQEFTEWHRVVVWNKAAENCSKYLSKGRTVLVEGRLQTRSWEDQKSGTKKYVTEIVANTVQFVGGAQRDRGEQPAASLEGGSAGGGGGGGGGYQQQQQGGGSGGSSGGGNRPRPQQQYDGGGDTSQGFGGPETPALDDIPF
jgi:single-strand DNA-binding protein